MIVQGLNKTRLLAAALCAVLLLALNAPISSAHQAVYLPSSNTDASLQPAQAAEHHAILKSVTTATERYVPLDDIPRLAKPATFVARFIPSTPNRAHHIQTRRLDLGFWACAPPDHSL